MKTIRIACVRKIAHDDSLYGTGLWTPGEQRDIPADIAPFLLWHEDVWADARKAAEKKKYPVKPAKRPMSYRRLAEDSREPPLANLAHMSKTDLARYAALNFGERLDASKMSEAQMRSHIVATMRERA